MLAPCGRAVKFTEPFRSPLLQTSSLPRVCTQILPRQKCISATLFQLRQTFIYQVQIIQRQNYVAFLNYSIIFLYSTSLYQVR